MTIWGKIGGAATGLALGGPIGGLLGMVAGHYLIDDSIFISSEDKKKVIFTVGMIALSAKMAKADGRVTEDEVTAFKEIFEIDPKERENVARLFNLARQHVAGFEEYAHQLSDIYSDDPELLRKLLEGLFHIAEADGIFHPKEDSYLARVAEIFKISKSDYSHMKSVFVGCPDESPYQVFGVTPDISNEDLKKLYHKLVKDNHPDKMMAKGVPEEFIKIATDRLAALNEAYGTLAKERGL